MPNKFPENFLFGAATSAHQVEGGNHNDWTEWEKKNADRLAKEAGAQVRSWAGQSPIWEEVKEQAKDPFNYISGRAADHYNRFKEDFDIAKQLGHNAHRFSIEWSRIEPEEGVFDDEAIEHYRSVIRALKTRNLEPFVTLWHWTLPVWLSKKGGVSSRDFPYFFSRYAAFVVSKLGAEARYWMTLNEPGTIISNCYLIGRWTPQKKGLLSARRAAKMLASAHRKGYKAIKEIRPDLLVGFGHLMTYAEPFNPKSPFDRIAGWLRHYFSNVYFLKLAGMDTHDYYALQYYFHARLSFPQTSKNANERISDMGWELYPEGIYHLCMWLKNFKKPIYITENGLADMHDKYRAWFIRESLANVKKAMDEGADVRGYFYWSLLDNFEWSEGFWPRFGLVEVDYNTMERKIRPSAWEYKKIIEEGL